MFHLFLFYLVLRKWENILKINFKSNWENGHPASSFLGTAAVQIFWNMTNPSWVFLFKYFSLHEAGQMKKVTLKIELLVFFLPSNIRSSGGQAGRHFSSSQGPWDSINPFLHIFGVIRLMFRFWWYQVEWRSWCGHISHFSGSLHYFW